MQDLLYKSMMQYLMSQILIPILYCPFRINKTLSLAATLLGLYNMYTKYAY